MTWTCGPIGVSSPTTFTDDFERADRTLNDNGWTPAGIYPTGTSTENSTRHLQIVSGRVTLPALTGAGYAIRSVRGLRKMTVSVRWSGVGSTDTSYVGLVASKIPVADGLASIGVNAVHSSVGRDARQLALYNGSISAAVDTESYTAIATGTDVTYSIEWDGADTVTITDVDGGTETYTSSLVKSLWGDTAYIEVFNTDAATDRIASINSVVLEGDSTVELSGHDVVEWDGDEITISADLPAATVTDQIALRDQFTGLDLNVDQPVVPITSTEDPTIDGFYRINSVAVDDTVGTYLTGGIGSQVTVQAVKVSGASAPLVEVSRRGALRSNTHAYTDDVAVTGLPGGFKAPRFTVAQDDEASVPVEGGSVQVFADATSDMSVTYGIVPDSFYEGAATIEVSYDLSGSAWWPVVGRQVQNLPGFVRLGNGRVRVTLSLRDGATLLGSEVWDATLGQWERCDFNVTDSGSPTTITTYTHAYINGPYDIAAGPDGNLWFTGAGNSRIWKVTPAGALTTYSITAAGMARPHGITSGPDGNIWFTAWLSNDIGKITSGGTITAYTDSNVSGPESICEGPDGLLWFTSGSNSKIGKVTTTGTFTFYTDANISGPVDICSGPDGLLWITSQSNDRIAKITTAGVVTTYSAGVGNAPNRICSGPDGLLWYTRTDDDAICKITTAGVVTTYTAGVPNAPNYICSDGTDLWFTYQDGIGKITTAGTVTTYTKATVDNPQGIVKGSDGNLWFTSYDNNRVGVLDPASGVVGPVEFGGTLTVLRNSPESCTIRVGAADGPELLDLTLRRGSNFIEGFMQSTTSSTYGIFRTESETGANLGTYGVRANAANTYGNKYTMLSPQTVTQDSTGVSGLTLTGSATSFKFAFSPEAADTVDGGASMVQAYFAAVNEKQKVSAR